VTLGPHVGFIVAAYIAAIAVVVALVIWVITDYRTQRRMLTDLELRSGDRRAEHGPRA